MVVERLQFECRLGSSLVCHLGSSPYLHHLGSSPYLQQVFNAKHPSERCSVVDEHTARAVHLVRPRLMKERRDRILYSPPCADMSVAEFHFLCMSSCARYGIDLCVCIFSEKPNFWDNAQEKVREQ